MNFTFVKEVQPPKSPAKKVMDWVVLLLSTVPPVTLDFVTCAVRTWLIKTKKVKMDICFFMILSVKNTHIRNHKYI